MNIVLIVSDTLRRDHLGCYGNETIHTPYLDGFASKAIIFDRCYASSFPTVPARADIFTGRYTFTHLGWGPLPQQQPTLAQLLSSTGYMTIGVADTPFLLRNGYGYDRGFDDFIWIRGQRYNSPERPNVTRYWREESDRFAPRTFSAAERWLRQHYDEDFFLYIDTWDPHEPWDAPEHYARIYDSSYNGEDAPWPTYWFWEEAGLTEDDLARAHTCYCAEITMVDYWFGRLLSRIEALGLMDETIIIFLSDHGFYFGEHGLFGKGLNRADHGYAVGIDPCTGAKLYRDPVTGEEAPAESHWYRSPLYDELTRVPLLIYHPEVQPGQIDTLVTLPDLMPTLLEMIDTVSPENVQANSLLPLLKGEGDRLHDFIITSWPLYNPGDVIRVVDDWERQVREPLSSTVTDGDWTLIYSSNDGPVELYHHTAQDPSQRLEVSRDHPEIARRLHSTFVEFLETHDTDPRLIQSRHRLSL